jgi:hypothetical protein
VLFALAIMIGITRLYPTKIIEVKFQVGFTIHGVNADTQNLRGGDHALRPWGTSTVQSENVRRGKVRVGPFAHATPEVFQQVTESKNDGSDEAKGNFPRNI